MGMGGCVQWSAVVIMVLLLSSLCMMVCYSSKALSQLQLHHSPLALPPTTIEANLASRHTQDDRVLHPTLADAQRQPVAHRHRQQQRLLSTLHPGCCCSSLYFHLHHCATLRLCRHRRAGSLPLAGTAPACTSSPATASPPPPP